MSARWLKTAALARFAPRIKARYGEKYLNEPAIRSLGLMMLTQDPPAHSRLRGLVTKAFTARSSEALRERIEAIAHELIDEVEGKGSMDVIADFAHKLPVEVICDMLGIPEAHRERFTRGSQVSGRLIDPTPMSDEELSAPMSVPKFLNSTSTPCLTFEGMTLEKI